MIKQGKNKGVILLVTVMVITVISICLAAYAIWAAYDQKNLIRHQQADKANALALAGLERAKADLFLDSGSWLDGEINGTAVTVPNPSQPDTLYNLYTDVALGEGTYTVQIDYLQDPKSCTSGCTFYDKRMWVRSTGTVGTVGSTFGVVSRTLEEIVSWYVVKNVSAPPAPGGKLYSILKPAVGDSTASANDLGITQVTLTENVNVDSKNVIIRGCYDSEFQFRNCMNYPTRISGKIGITDPTVWIKNTSDVQMGGITIE